MLREAKRSRPFALQPIYRFAHPFWKIFPLAAGGETPPLRPYKFQFVKPQNDTERVVLHAVNQNPNDCRWQSYLNETGPEGLRDCAVKCFNIDNKSAKRGHKGYCPF